MRALILGPIFLLVITAQAAFSDPVKVFVSIVPQKYFVEKIGGDLVAVSVMVEPGASPATYEPKPKQMVSLARANIYYAIGVPFEKTWLTKIAATNPGMLVVHTEAGIEKIPMLAHYHHGKVSHGHEGEAYHVNDERHGQRQDHAGIKDPHVWLSPPLVMLQARNILVGLLTVDPTHRSVYEENYRNFIAELVVLDEQLRETFAGSAADIEFMVFHPAWGYFAATYGLRQIPIEIEGKEPKPAELEQLIHHVKERGIKLIFVQPQFSRRTAQMVARAIEGKIAFADPLANDWANNLREVAAQVKDALR